MSPRFGFSWSDFYSSSRLQDLQKVFLDYVKTHNHPLHNRITCTTKLDDDLILLSLLVEQFLVELFQLESIAQIKYDKHHQSRLASHFKRSFIQRDALHSKNTPSTDTSKKILEKLSDHLGQNINPNDEITFAHLGLAALNRNDENAINLFREYSAWAHHSTEGKKIHAKGFLFKHPQKTDSKKLFLFQHEKGCVVSDSRKNRSGFNLTDSGISTSHAIDEAFYCIKCHDREKDSCRKGFKNTDSSFQLDAHSQPLSGCPLDQKISEMNILFEQGHLIASLAVVTLDNPMVAATGHRICYDCSRSCIFQKQTPVDIPSIETRLLKDVLALPYGFEIYSLLTRWNPLNLKHPTAEKDSGYNVLVVGQGPSGFALAHLMMQYGHNVTAIDGLKIEPLPDALKNTNLPIREISQYFEPLSKRYASGFGGVAEYGITSRWDKNFLLVIRLLLERRKLYQCLSGVRFGSSITINSAFNEYGFDHIALCLGAGSPTLLSDPNMTAPGVRLASDFLMALNIGEAAQLHTKTTLRIQLPAIIIGAGLTAIDAATEALAYYPIQVMNFYIRHQHIHEQLGQHSAEAALKTNPKLADIFLKHGRIILKERDQAKIENRPPNYIQYVQQWGGVKIYYRKTLQESPAYKLNPHELQNALSEGVSFVEFATPTSIETDDRGSLSAVVFQVSNKTQVVKAKTLLVAAGTKPNTVLASECEELSLDGHFFSPQSKGSFFIHKTFDGRHISYLGDLHPQYSGSVVKALASAKSAAPEIHKKLLKLTPKSNVINLNGFFSQILSIAKKSNTLHLTIKSLAAAKNYRPGQFFKLQPYGPTFTEATPLSPTLINPQKGEIKFQINMVGASTRQLEKLTLNTPVFLMGPAGAGLPTPKNTPIIFLQEVGVDLDILAPLVQSMPLSEFKKISGVNDLCSDLLQRFDTFFLLGSLEFVESISKSLPKKTIYTFIHTHLQCMMKQVCAQCIYSTTRNQGAKKNVTFGCAKNIAETNKIKYADLIKRNNNEQLEEAQLTTFHLSISDSSNNPTTPAQT